MQHISNPKFIINALLLCGVILLALVVIPEITDAYAQLFISPITINLHGEQITTFNFERYVSAAAGEVRADVRFTISDPRVQVVGGATPFRDNQFNTGEFTDVMLIQTDRDATDTITMPYSITGVAGDIFRIHSTLTINLNPAEAFVLPSATVERPTYIPFLPSQLFSVTNLKFSDYVDTRRDRSDFDITLTYKDPAQYQIIDIRRGTDALDDDFTFTVQDDVIGISPLLQDDFIGTITFVMTVAPTVHNAHFVRSADGTRLLNTETFEIQLVISDTQTILERSVNVSLPADKLELNYKDFITTDRPFSDWDIELTYKNSADFDKLEAIRGTDAPNGDFTFEFTSETVVFALRDSTFRGTIPLSMKITPTPTGSHFVGSDTTILFSDTIDVNLLVPAPVTPPILASITHGTRGDIDFSIVTDSVDRFDQLTITFDTTESTILDHGSFIGGINSTTGPAFEVDSETVRFSADLDADLDATPGVYLIPYTAVNSIGAINSGVMTISITLPTLDDIAANTLIASPIPTTQNVPVMATQDEDSIIDFTSYVFDPKDDLDTLVISINTDDSSTTGPTGVTSPASFFTFNTADTTDNTNSLTVISADRTVRFITDFITPPGEYTFPYTATDSDSNTSDGNAHIAITVSPRINTDPTAMPITKPASGIDDVDIDFYSAISDEIGVDSDLRVTFSFDNPDHRSIFVPSSSSATVDSTDSNLFTLTVNPVVFEFLAAPSATTVIGLSYIVTDRNDGTNDSTVTITYTVDTTSTNVAPVAMPIVIDTEVIIGIVGSNGFTVDFRGNVSDMDDPNDDLIIRFTPPSHLSVNAEDATLNAITGTYTLVQNPVRINTTSSTVAERIFFNYMVSDAEGLSDPSTVSFIASAATCNSENLNSNDLGFDRVENGEPSDEISFMVRNIGNISLDLNLSAGNWTNPSDQASNQENPVMYANSTAYAILPEQVYKSKIPFLPSGVNTINAIEPTIRQSIYLQLNATLIDDSFRGIIEQELKTVISCFP